MSSQHVLHRVLCFKRKNCFHFLFIRFLLQTIRLIICPMLDQLGIFPVCAAWWSGWRWNIKFPQQRSARSPGGQGSVSEYSIYCLDLQLSASLPVRRPRLPPIPIVLSWSSSFDVWSCRDRERGRCKGSLHIIYCNRRRLFLVILSNVGVSMVILTMFSLLLYWNSVTIFKLNL